MTTHEIIEKARKSGAKVSEKLTEPGHFVIEKKGMVVVEAFSVCGSSVIVIDATGRYPAQVCADDWTDIIFPI